MCHECDNVNEFDHDDNFLDDIPEEEREEFVTYACNQFNSIIEKADKHNILTELITEWSTEKQAAFTYACVMGARAESIEQAILNDEDI